MIEEQWRELALSKLREPFPANQIGTLPKPYKANSEKGKCRECGGHHGLPAVHLEYVGHAALTDRLLDADAEWSWRPLALDERGLPAFDRDGGLWIELTVAGVTRLGYGDASGKSGSNAIKEAIGDALRNAGMRFGAALDLWHKGDLHDAQEERGVEPAPDPVREAKDRLAAVVKARGMELTAFAGWAMSAKGPGLNLGASEDVAAIDRLTARVEAEGNVLEPSHAEAVAVVQETLGGTE